MGSSISTEGEKTMRESTLAILLLSLGCLLSMAYGGAENLTPVTAKLSSTSFPHFAATVCIDGELKARHKLCHSKKEDAPWFALDFGEDTQVSVEKVLLYNRHDGSFERTKNVEIRISNELPKNGKTMATCGEALGPFKGPATKGQINEIDSGSGWEKKTGRYLIVQMKGTHINLHEVEAVGISYVANSKDAEKLTPVTAKLSSTSFPHFAATVCIDGELKARHKLCHSKKEDAPWFALDFGEDTQVSVEKVLIYNRHDGSFERTKNVEIRISNELPKNGKTMATCG